MATIDRERLRSIKRFDQLVAYLRDELDWPIDTEDFDDLTFDYEPEELGIDPKNAAKIEIIKQLRPLVTDQPWGIFWIKFRPKRLPVVALRRILGQLVTKKRASADKDEQPTWNLDDLMLISAIGEDDERQITFAHFADEPQRNLPTLRILGWDGADTILKLDHLDRELHEHLAWPEHEANHKAWRAQWSDAFKLRHREVINTSKELSVRLAELARNIRKLCNAALALETESGPLRKLMAAFREALIHDLDEGDFADMYAQTIAYGLLSARVSRHVPGEDPALMPEDVSTLVLPTNPFLKELMETFFNVGGRKWRSAKGRISGIDFDELGINDVVDLLKAANMDAVLRDFGDKKPQEDPVIHFYELFLKEYDAKKRMQRGVFYTPRPVVSFIVRSVDEMLRAEFGLEDGLADTTTWGEMIERFNSPPLREGSGEGEPLKLPEIEVVDPKTRKVTKQSIDPDTPFVVILDPAVGTGTFLVEVIDLIYKTMTAKWEKEGHLPLTDIPWLWNEYVPNHILPRLHGYELMMAPYAIAHMKIGLKLHETGYRFGSDERARIFLTNSLEPPHDLSDRFEQMAPALAHEAQQVNDVKRHQRFTVVIGNPPYSYMSANLEEHHRSLVEPYKYVDGQRIRERGALQFELNLQDDYVKFLRLAEITSERSGAAVTGMVTNNSYLANVTFRGLRQHLLSTYSASCFLNLHGSLKAGTDLGKDGRDENVFDIQQGVAIALLARGRTRGSPSVVYGDLRGSREFKYEQLLGPSPQLSMVELTPRSPEYLLIPRDETLATEYESGLPINEFFELSSTGIMTNRDGLAISTSQADLATKASIFVDENRTDQDVGRELGLKDNAIWSLKTARRSVTEKEWKKSIAPIDYRPFDRQLIVYHSAVVSNMRKPVMSQLADGANLCLLTCRQQIVPGFRHVFVTRNYFECCLVSLKSREKTSGFPLWRSDPGVLGGASRTTNVAPATMKWFNSSLFQESDPGERDLSEDTFHVIYAELHSPAYRERYCHFIQRGFPRVFPPKSPELSLRLGEQGRALVGLHLLESPLLDKPITKYAGLADSEVEKATYIPENKTVWLDKAQTRGFVGVPEKVWNFHIGGYQVCHKWLKDRQAKGGKNPRPGRKLTADDIAHYQKIVVALSETIRIMAEIDEVIDAHGGWPNAFVTDKSESES